MALFAAHHKISIYDIYKINTKSNKIDVKDYGEWTPEAGLKVFNGNIWRRRADTKGFHLRYNIF